MRVRGCIGFNANLTITVQLVQQKAAAASKIKDGVMHLDRIFEFKGIGLAAEFADLPLPLKVALIVVIAVSLFHFLRRPREDLFPPVMAGASIVPHKLQCSLALAERGGEGPVDRPQQIAHQGLCARHDFRLNQHARQELMNCFRPCPHGSASSATMPL